MLLSTSVKIFCAALFLPLIFSGCSLWRGEANTPSFVPPQQESDIPFSTREPDVFQVEIVTRAGGVERRITVARDKNTRRIDYDVDTDSHRAVIISDKEYVLDLRRKTVSERELAAAGAMKKEVSSLLNVRDYADFDEVGRQGSVIEYRARVNESDASDVSIFFDESIGLPVRQDFYSVNGDERKLKYSVELRNFSREVDLGVFEIPHGFRRESR